MDTKYSTDMPVSFDRFRRRLAEWLEIDEQRVVPQAYFITDLAVDSVKMVELFVLLSEAGYVIDVETAWQIQTVEDAYRLLVQVRQLGDQAESGP